MTQLHFGDNLGWLKRQSTDSVDLCYIDPPFNSKADYNIQVGDAQVKAFGDTWSWGAEDMRVLVGLFSNNNDRVARWAKALEISPGPCGMSSYLLFMAERLLEIQRVLKPTGSIYVHCDDSADFHLRTLMNSVFGPDSYQNTIHWKRSVPHNDPNRMGRITDTVLFYGSAPNAVYLPYPQTTLDRDYREIEQDTGRRYQLTSTTAPGRRGPEYTFLGVKRFWRYTEENMKELHAQGRIVQTKAGAVPRYKRYLDEMPGLLLQDWWDDIAPLGKSSENVGYPTQKPVALLERIILASSNPGDLVMDCFLGSGTTAVAVIKNGRRFIGCDLSFQAIEIAVDRLAKLEPLPEVSLTGYPTTLEDAHALAERDKFGYQAWALDMVGCNPSGDWTAKKGKDSGVDGKRVQQLPDGTIYTTIVSVKAGKPKLVDVRDLIGTVAKENAQRGVLLMLDDPTKDMIATATMAGINGHDEARCLILTAADLLAGKKIPEVKI